MGVLVLEIWGDFACFTRPEAKVERLSYPIMTPPAARNFFDTIYLDFDQGKPPRPVFRWEPRRITLLEPPRYIALMRNEVKEKASERTIKTWMRNPEAFEPLLADATEESKGRTQRQTMALKRVRYRVEAEAVLFREDHALRRKIEESFTRRARAGQCYFQPYLGCREFAAYFRFVEPGEQPARPAPVNETIGLMVYDIFDLSRPGDSLSKPRISLFDAEIRDGVLEIPPYSDPRVRKIDVPGVTGRTGESYAG